MYSGSGAEILSELNCILNGFKEIKARELSPLVLAYIGDAFFEIIARTMTVSKGNAPVNVLHKRNSAIVKAKTQAEMYFKIEESPIARSGNLDIFSLESSITESEYDNLS